MDRLTEGFKALTLGDIVAFVLLLVAFIAGINKLYEYFDKPKKKNTADHERLEKLILEKTLSIEKLIGVLNDDIKNSRETDALMIRVRIKEWHLKFTSRKWITIDELAMFKELLDEYWKLGHNHLSSQYLKDVEKLETKPYGYD